MSHPVLVIAVRHWGLLLVIPMGAVMVALVALSYQPVRWEARAVLLATALTDREAIELRASSGRLARLLGLASTEQASARIGRSARVDILAEAPEPRRAVAVANAVARALTFGPWTTASSPPVPAPTLEDEAVTATRKSRSAGLVVWAAVAGGIVAAMGLGGAVEFIKAGGLVKLWTVAVVALLLAGCATAPPCPCLYGRPVPVEFVQRCGA